MKSPAKGEKVVVDGYGIGTFVKGPDNTADDPSVWIKFGRPGDEEMVELSYERFKEKRVQ